MAFKEGFKLMTLCRMQPRRESSDEAIGRCLSDPEDVWL